MKYGKCWITVVERAIKNHNLVVSVVLKTCYVVQLSGLWLNCGVW